VADVLAIKLRADVEQSLRDLRKVDSSLDGMSRQRPDISGTATINASQALGSLQRLGRQALAAKKKLSPRGIARVVTAGATAALQSLGRLADKTLHKLASIGMTTVKWGGAAILAGATVASVAIVKLGADMEQTRLSFQTMLGSVKAGNAVLAKLADFANVTPFDTTEVIGAGKTLMAFGVEAQDLMGLLKQIGDVSAGTGKPLGELSQIIGKVMAKGKADTEILNQMTEAGIPIIKTLAAQYGVSGGEIYKMAEKGKLSSAVIVSAFSSMSAEGGMFANMMEKQSQMVGGKWSTIIGKLKLTAATIGEQLSPALQAGLDWLMKWVDKLGELAQSGDAVDWLVDFGVRGVETFGTVLVWLNRFYLAGLLAFRQLRDGATMMFNGIQYVVTGVFIKILEVAGTAMRGMVAAVNKARALIGKDPLKVDFDTDLEGLRIWRDSSKQMMADAAKGWAGGNLNKALDSDQAMTDRVDAATAKFRAGAEKFRATVKAGIKDRADGVGEEIPSIGKPEIPQPDTVKIKTSVEKPNLDELTKIGLYNFRIPIVPQADGSAISAGAAVARAGRGAIGAAAGKASISSAAVPAIDAERNSLLKQILAAVQVTPSTSYRLA
jgi:tape measure domain-containing protein